MRTRYILNNNSRIININLHNYKLFIKDINSISINDNIENHIKNIKCNIQKLKPLMFKERSHNNIIIFLNIMKTIIYYLNLIDKNNKNKRNMYIKILNVYVKEYKNIDSTYDSKKINNLLFNKELQIREIFNDVIYKKTNNPTHKIDFSMYNQSTIYQKIQSILIYNSENDLKYNNDDDNDDNNDDNDNNNDAKYDDNDDNDAKYDDNYDIVYPPNSLINNNDNDDDDDDDDNIIYSSIPLSYGFYTNKLFNNIVYKVIKVNNNDKLFTLNNNITFNNELNNNESNNNESNNNLINYTRLRNGKRYRNQ